MPNPEEYAEAIKRFGALEELAKQAWAKSPAADSGFTLALRWLRVGAAMEAGTLLSVQVSRDAPIAQQWGATYRDPEVGLVSSFAPDPLTAAERAMGVGT